MDTLSLIKQLIEKNKKKSMKATAPGEVDNFSNSKVYDDITIYAKKTYVPKMDTTDKHLFLQHHLSTCILPQIEK